MINRIIFFSGGKSSFAVAEYVKTHYPHDNIVLYFTDTLWEHDDLYRFIQEGSDKLQLPMLIHSKGLNPIQLMFEQKVLFNSRIGACSRELKMKVASQFLRKGIIPKIQKWRNQQFLKRENFRENAVLYLGIGFEEMHRQKAIIENWKPFEVRMPLIDHIIDPNEALAKYEIKQPVLYDLGFAHNNCFSRCVKAGQGHFKQLKEKLLEVFQKTMEQEHHLRLYVEAYHYIKQIKSDGRDGFTEDVRQSLYEELDEAYRDYFYDRAEKPKLYIPPAVSAVDPEFKKYGFMKKTKNGVTQPYPLRELSYAIDGKPYESYGEDPAPRKERTKAERDEIDEYDIGGCGCFVDVSGF